MSNTIPFKRFSTSLDCSRNAVINMASVKRWIDYTAEMGYNAVTLYTEDTYELEDEPYFGYARGRYSKAELKEINDYAKARGVEVYATINTLAHLGTLFRWKNYAEINDCADTLLCDDERTYALIEKMIATCSECLDSRIINVNMDEAELLGRGKYLELNGYHERIDILKRHMDKVCAIAKKYGYEQVIIAGDMPFRLATRSDDYGNTKAQVQVDVSDFVPDIGALEYWDYGVKSKEDFRALMSIHQQIKKENLWYLGGVKSWFSYTPENHASTRGLRNSVQASREQGLDNVGIATFGDDGGECSRFAVLPGVFYAGQIAKGITDEDEIKKNFEAMFGIPYDAFLLLDLTQRSSDGAETTVQPARYILYNDPFLGLMDPTIPEYTRADHEELMVLLKPWCDHPEWGYLFRMAYDLCAVTAAKCDVGMRIRAAYTAGDKQKLQELAHELRRIRGLVERFHDSFRKQWMIENKSFGFEVTDIRVGGVMTRLNTCANILEEYIRGEIEHIEELEMEQLDPRTPLDPDYGVRKYQHYWNRNARFYSDIVSTCVTDKMDN